MPFSSKSDTQSSKQMGWQERQEKCFFTQSVAGLHNLLLHGMGVLGVGVWRELKGVQIRFIMDGSINNDHILFLDPKFLFKVITDQ